MTQHCPTGFYRNSAVVWNCAGGHGDGKVVVTPKHNISVIKVPSGAEDFRITVTGGGNVHLALLDLESMTYFNPNPVAGMSAPVITGNEARIPGTNQGPVDVTVRNSGYADESLQMSYSYGGMSPCSLDQPNGCSRLYADAARQQARGWSCWAHQRYGSAGEAWAGLVLPTVQGSSVEGISWFGWNEVWKQWQEAPDKLAWQQTFSILDADHNEKVDFEEFKDGYFLCDTTEPAQPVTTMGEPRRTQVTNQADSDGTGWLFCGLLILCLFLFIAYLLFQLLNKRRQRPEDTGFTPLVHNGVDAEMGQKDGMKYANGSGPGTPMTPEVSSIVEQVQMRHGMSAGSFVAAPAPPAVKVGEWEQGGAAQPLPPRRKGARGCDACINPKGDEDQGWWASCVGMDRQAAPAAEVRKWRCPCGTSFPETTPSCTKCGAFRPSVAAQPLAATQITKVAAPPGVHAMEKPIYHSPAPMHAHFEPSYNGSAPGHQSGGSDYHGAGHHYHGPPAHGAGDGYNRGPPQAPTPLVLNGHGGHGGHDDGRPYTPSSYQGDYTHIETPRPVDEIDATIQTMIRSAESVSVQEDGCEFLKNVAGDDEGRMKAQAYGAIEAIIAAMGHHPHSAHLQEQACAALCRFVSDVSTTEDEVARLGGIEAILQSMRMHPANERVQERACEALQQLSMTPADRRRILHGGGIELIEQAMQHHRECAGVQECSCLALGNLAFEAEGRDLIARYGGLSAIIQALRGHIHDIGVLEAACFVIHNMACTLEYTQKIKDLGGLEAIEEAQRVNVSLRDQEEAIAAVEILMAP